MQLKLLMVLNTYMAEMLVCLFLVMAKSRVFFYNSDGTLRLVHGIIRAQASNIGVGPEDYEQS